MRIKFYDNLTRGIRRKFLEWRIFSLRHVGKIFILASVVFGVVLLSGDYGAAMRGFVLDKGNRLAIASGLEVKQVSIIGVRHTPSSLLNSILNNLEGRALYFVDIDDLRMRLQSLGWLQDVTVTRIFPDHLEIRVIEHIPQAIWQLQKRHYLVTADGDIISDKISDNFINLPLVVGEGANLHLAELYEILSQSDFLRSEFVSAVRVGERRWDIHLTDDVVVKLPQTGAADAWRDLHRLAREELLLEHGGIDVLDMRIQGRLIIRFKGGDEAEFPYRGEGRGGA